MTASIAHFAVGMAVGTVVAAPRLWRQWRERQPLAAPIRRWLLWSYGFGLYAVVPNMLLRCGLPEGFFGGAWANVFLLHPLLNSTGAGGLYKGAACAAAIFATQYLVILAAIRRHGAGVERRLQQRRRVPRDDHQQHHLPQPRTGRCKLARRRVPAFVYNTDATGEEQCHQ